MLFILLLNSILSPQSLHFVWLLCHRDEKGQDVFAAAVWGEQKALGRKDCQGWRSHECPEARQRFLNLCVGGTLKDSSQPVLVCK